MQEEDVFHVRPVKQRKLTFDICGTNPDARFPPELVEYTGQTNYAGSGGCFFRTEFFKRLAKTDWRAHLQNIPAEWLHADVVLSVLTYKNGGTIGYCTECAELNRPEYGTGHAVIHQYKLYYETPLCRLAGKYLADKCPRIGHTYTPEYHKLLHDKKVTNFLEIGIGNVPLMSPLAGQDYRPGASLRMWRDYFPGANIYGCDIDRSVLFEEDRIKTFWVDQSSAQELEAHVPKIEYDVILDDGSHVPEHMVTTFETLWPRVAPDGLYIIEDVADSTFEQLKKLGPVIHTHRGSTNGDGFIVFKKPAQKVLWVSAFRDIGRERWAHAYRSNDEYFACFERLVDPLGKDLVCFIDEPHADRVRKLGVRTLPFDIEDTYIPKHYPRQKELIDKKQFHQLLPEHVRMCQEYTNPDYGLTLYSKQCFIRRASELFPDYTHYAFIDFGYAKTPLVTPVSSACKPLPDDQVYISSFRQLDFDEDREPVLGAWGVQSLEGAQRYNWNNLMLLVKEPLYTVQGNLWFVPKKLTHWLEQAMDHSIERQHAAGVILGHDEPVWLSIIHDFRSRFKINVKTEWQSWNWV